MGPGYRNVIGIPGGITSPLMRIIQEENKDRMNLVAGNGNTYRDGRPTENDRINTIYVIDSDKLPFYRAEVYHQFHNGGCSTPFELCACCRVASMARLLCSQGLASPLGRSTPSTSRKR